MPDVILDSFESKTTLEHHGDSTTAAAVGPKDHPDLIVALGALLDRAIEAQRADFGAVRLYEPERDVLRLVAQRNFDPALVATTTYMRPDDGALRAFHEGRVIIEDLLTDPRFAENRALSQSFGIRGVQLTPIVTRDGKRLGLLSTHFKRPHTPSPFSLLETDRIVATAAEVIELWTTEYRTPRAGPVDASHDLRQAMLMALKSAPPRPGFFGLPQDVASVLTRATHAFAQRRREQRSAPEQMIVEIKQILREINDSIPVELRRDLSSDVIRWSIEAYYSAPDHTRT